MADLFALSFIDDGEGALPDQILGVVLVIANRFHDRSVAFSRRGYSRKYRTTNCVLFFFNGFDERFYRRRFYIFRLAHDTTITHGRPLFRIIAWKRTKNRSKSNHNITNCHIVIITLSILVKFIRSVANVRLVLQF